MMPCMCTRLWPISPEVSLVCTPLSDRPFRSRDSRRVQTDGKTRWIVDRHREVRPVCFGWSGLSKTAIAMFAAVSPGLIERTLELTQRILYGRAPEKHVRPKETRKGQRATTTLVSFSRRTQYPQQSPRSQRCRQ